MKLATSSLGFALVLSLVGCAETPNVPTDEREQLVERDSAVSTCEHSLCSVGSNLSDDCDSCAQAICDVDPFCCAVAWDDLCVSDVQSVCSQSCDGGTDTGGTSGGGTDTGGTGGGGTAPQTCEGARPDATGLDAEEQAFLVTINQHRQQNGLGPLTACTSLSRGAQGHSEDMRDNDYFSHTSQSGAEFTDRSCSACYELGCEQSNGFVGTAMGENIAAGDSGAAGTFLQWKNSPGHNANMLGSSFTVIGIGRATGGGTFGTYWTTVFGGASEASCQ
jgi:uncharacterized protein YkwD